jgi:tetratricopeptide (TPR) repeat protein
VLSVQEIAARLDDRFRLLTGGGRTALRRQQTLQALVDWSYDLLSEPERALLRRLGVFAGGWTLAAAEAVAGCGSLEPGDVLDLLTGLVDKSLTLVDETSDRTRYRLLETIRQYAQDKLLAAGEAVEVRNRHRDVYLALAERALPELTRPDQVAWFRRLDADHDNLRAALEWCRADAAGAETQLRLTAAMGRFWRIRGHLLEGRDRMLEALARAGAAPTAARATALNFAGHFESLFGDLERGLELGEESVAVARVAGDGRVLCFALRQYALTLTMRGDRAVAHALFEEALQTALAIGDDREVAYVRAELGSAALLDGDVAAAEQLLGESVRAARLVGDATALSAPLNRLGWLALDRGDLDEADALFAESLALCESIGYPSFLVNALLGQGAVATRRGAYESARAKLRRALTLARDSGGGASLAAGLVGVAGLEMATSRAERSARFLGAAEPWLTRLTRVTMSDDQLIRRALEATLGPTALERALAAGRAMGLDDAGAEALRAVESPASGP